jgi:predicted transcriptional regulator
MARKILNIGIMSRQDYIQRTIAIAKGDYQPLPDEPKIWFESVKSMAQVLSDENQALLDLIIRHQPQSLSELEQLSQRKKPNLSRTLKTLERYGVVELHKQAGKLAPTVKATDFRVQFGLHHGNAA